MSLGTSDSDQHRITIGLVFLVLGVLLLVWAWGSWAYRTTSPEEVPAITQPDEDERVSHQQQVVSALALFLLIAFLLILVVLVGSLIIVRSARRYHAATNHKRAPPTVAEDTWVMHKLPPERNRDRLAG